MDESRGSGELERLRAAGDSARRAGPGVRPGDSALIEFRGVSHTYHSLLGRRVRAVEDFSLAIGESEVFGLAGPNGAGKSTLIALLLGYLEPTHGTVRIAGVRPRFFVERYGMGYVSELIAIPPRWTLDDALRRYAILAGVPSHESARRIGEVIELLGLDEHRDKRVKQLSKGNLQRLGLAQALLHDERVIILDEPTHGLDPVWTQRFRDVISALRRPGRVIFIASHNLDELQRLADRVAIIDRGRLQRIVDPRSAASATGSGMTPYVINVIAANGALESVFPGAARRGDGEYELPALDARSLNDGIARLIAGGVLVTSLRPAHSVLEQQFREAIGE